LYQLVLYLLHSDLELSKELIWLLHDTYQICIFQFELFLSIRANVTYNFNQIQVFTLLALMAQITGKTPGQAYHKIINAHIYEDQVELMRDVQLKREPYPSPKLEINPDIKSLKDLETWVTLDDFNVVGYQHHDAIKYPFSV
jgi:thymidylate synthase